MQFIDESKIYLKSGNGGNGCLSFRREANIPKGGPDGGNGGRGGHIIFRCVAGLNTLIDFRYNQHFRSQRGFDGAGKNCSGRSAQDTYIDVPVGTQVFSEDGELLLVDMTKVGQEKTLLHGGDGGIGNAHFKSSTNQAPRRTIPGQPGSEMWVWLKLKLISDVGLVGLPNAGKSTFLSKVSRAKPKIADYPFTTLKPQLGVVYQDEKEFVMADIPGLVEGAHKGIGLGIRFLKHIERCSVILHLIDGTSEDVAQSYKTIREELEKYSPTLAAKQEIVVLNKCDSLSLDEAMEKKGQIESVCNKGVFLHSSITGAGTPNVLRSLLNEIHHDEMEVPELLRKTA